MGLQLESGKPNLLYVTIDSGKDLLAMDRNQSSDPFVKLSVVGQRHQTTSVEKTLKPHWDERFAFVLPDAHNTLELVEEDEDHTINDFLGRAQLVLADVLESNVEKHVAVPLLNKRLHPDKDRGTLHLRLLWVVDANAESITSSSLKKKKARSLLPVDRHEWVAGVHSVQLPFAQHSRDLLRVARRVTGHGVGVVLGGGGARGLAHVGVLRALEECGVHVDAVGGTSIGAFVGAAYALHAHEPAQLDRAARALARALSSVAERLRDLTLPVSSFFSGARFNASVRAALGDAAIEELALDFFCVSTDIAKSRLHVHERGCVWKAVRASMTLQGYLPPISERGSVLLDGGYMNNLPADVMKDARGIRYIVAVDVGSEPRRDYYAYGAALSGWWLLWNKLNPFARTVSVPSMGDVSAALAYVSSERHKERVKAECVDLYLRPPVSAYGTLQFDKMDEIVDVGYRYALPRIRAWADQVLAAEPDADIVERSAKAPRRSGQPSPRAAGKSEEVAGA